nr:EOG090X04K8 [Eulimnadia texana]
MLPVKAWSRAIATESSWNSDGDESGVLIQLLMYYLFSIPTYLGQSLTFIYQFGGKSKKYMATFNRHFLAVQSKTSLGSYRRLSVFIKNGRRKTWLVPTQYLLGVAMLVLSGKVNEYLGENESTPPNVKALTLSFFALNFLAATQDIAVDGWALTMLHRRNVGYASTCNSVGQTAGYFLGYVIFMALESADFCNKYLRTVPETSGMVTLAGFLYFWGIVFIVTTTLVWALKPEQSATSYPGEGELDLNVVQTYKLLWKILKLPSIQWTIVVLLTCKIGFSAADAVSGLKLVEIGVPKTQLALLAVPLVPLQIILPLMISRYTAGPLPMEVFLKAMPPRLLFGAIYAGLLWVTPLFKLGDGQYPWYYYGIVLIIYAVHQVTVYSMFVAVMAFFAKISDPAVGGTYMTLLNTVCNLGGNWPSTVALWLVDSLTWKSCSAGSGDNQCRDANETEACTMTGGQCITTIDGYYIESFVCIVIGFLWLGWGKKTIQHLQKLNLSSWKVV